MFLMSPGGRPAYRHTFGAYATVFRAAWPCSEVGVGYRLRQIRDISPRSMRFINRWKDRQRARSTDKKNINLDELTSDRSSELSGPQLAKKWKIREP